MTRRIDKPDTSADMELRELMGARQSFIMVAGAGSGKTTSLVKALDFLQRSYGVELQRNKQKIACITYTTGAVDEILNDVNRDQIFHVSTIHSFLWDVIQPFQSDIKAWVTNRIAEKIEELKVAAIGFTSRVQQKTRDKNADDQVKLVEQLNLIGRVNKFTYETGSDYLNGIIGHSDVIKMACTLIADKPMLRKIISKRYPFIFVDESQDTLPDLVAALRTVDSEFSNEICLGFFGDPMQKIYLTGIGVVPITEGWGEVTKPENFRCPTDVLNVINNLRSGIDNLQQTGGRRELVNEKWEPVVGSANLFILPADENRNSYISQVKQFLAKKLSDDLWLTDNEAYVESADLKMLMIEHRMAAIRLKFPSLFSAFKDSKNESLSAAFTEGNAWPLRPLMKFVIPLVEAFNNKKHFQVIELLRENSPKLMKQHFADGQIKVAEVFKQLKAEVAQLADLCATTNTAKVKDVIKFIKDNNLYLFDERYLPFLAQNDENADIPNDDLLTNEVIDSMFECEASELWGYRTYINDESPYSTQHSVKGAEFERVMVILDDEEGKKSTLYSYEKLFGIKELSKTDLDNLEIGKETVLDRTRRLLYVCCSRTMKDLAILFFVADVDTTYSSMKDAGVFKPECIFTLDKLK